MLCWYQGAQFCKMQTIKNCYLIPCDKNEWPVGYGVYFYFGCYCLLLLGPLRFLVWCLSDVHTDRLATGQPTQLVIVSKLSLMLFLNCNKLLFSCTHKMEIQIVAINQHRADWNVFSIYLSSRNMFFFLIRPFPKLDDLQHRSELPGLPWLRICFPYNVLFTTLQ